MLELKEKDKIFFIADPHFYHDSIIDYCNRPFKQNYFDEGYQLTKTSRLEVMNNTLITNWNNKISKDEAFSKEDKY